MSISKFTDRLSALGLIVDLKGDEAEIKLEEDGVPVKVYFKDDWTSILRGFYRAKQYKFNEPRRFLVANRFVEFQVTKLDPTFIYRPNISFQSNNGDEVVLCKASNEFLLSFFESTRYEEVFHLIRNRIDRRISRAQGSARRRRVLPMSVEDFFLNIYTATYKPKRKQKTQPLEDIGLKKVKACLFNLAYSHHESWEVRDEIKSRGFSYPRLLDEEVSLEIPNAVYDQNLVSYYKVAKSSSFPGQCFLSYYHILEYHFLRVADEQLFQAVKAKLNDPAFKSTYKNVSNLLATIKRNDSVGDEKEMLRAVLRKYVAEEDFIEFVKELQNAEGENIYTSSKQKILGQEFNIRLEPGHALSNFGSVLKHIRNCLVHSSDRYSREETFLPLTASEDLIVKYIPIMEYLAEKVIFSTAE